MQKWDGETYQREIESVVRSTTIGAPNIESFQRGASFAPNPVDWERQKLYQGVARKFLRTRPRRTAVHMTLLIS
ncbi:MAG: hypothetical protein R2849_21710 [Thermomicrobiales bacterium]